MYEYKAELIRVIDGDTLELRIDCGFRVWHVCKVRLLGVNAPELHKRAEIVMGKLSLSALAEHLQGKPLVVRTTKADDWQRWLAILWIEADKESVNDWLLRMGYAKRSQI